MSVEKRHAFPDLTPSEVYTEREAKEAIESAKRLLEGIDVLLKEYEASQSANKNAHL